MNLDPESYTLKRLCGKEWKVEGRTIKALTVINNPQAEAKENNKHCRAQDRQPSCIMSRAKDPPRPLHKRKYQL